jgi:hypothetical protein
MASVGGSSRNSLVIGLAAVVGLMVGIYAFATYFPDASNEGFSPDQPIPFSHKIHAGQNKIDCKYCHVSVERSRHATIPALNVCMNCHSLVKTDSKWIQQIRKAYSEGRPVEWVRVHELPDYVYFPHKRHVAKGVACETCHGNVKEMEQVYQFAPMNMGWCLDCHRGKTTPRNVMAQVYPGVKNPQGPVATIDCNACHH